MNVLNLSWYIIRRRYTIGKPVSHLELQSILYRLQVNSDKPLFNERFYILFYMPVVEKVFREFNIYASVDILPTRYNPNPNIELSEEQLQIIDNTSTLVDDKWDIIKTYKGERLGYWELREYYR